MRTIYKQAVSGTLASVESDTTVSVQLSNNLAFSINLYATTSTGSRQFVQTIGHDNGATITGTEGDAIIVTCLMSGSFICSFTLSGSMSNIAVDPSVLTPPNDIGPIPQPTTEILVPVNSPLVMVGTNLLPNGNIITREQYWNLQGDSYSLVVGESRTVSYSTASGRQSTSSSEESVAASIGVNGQIGWGPVSAGLSGSLNAQSSHFQQVTVEEESTAYSSETVSNDTTEDFVVLRWQMMDLITVYEPAQFNPISSVVSGLSPVIVQRYDISSLVGTEADALPAPRTVPVTAVLN